MSKTKDRLHKKEWFRKLKENAPCLACGESDPSCIEFHHIDPKKKQGNVSHMVRNGATFEAVKREVEKCVPLCANCHRKVNACSLELYQKEEGKEIYVLERAGERKELEVRRCKRGKFIIGRVIQV